MEESTEKYTVHNGRIVTPGTIKQLKNHAIVHIVDRLPGGGKKKGQKKQNKDETRSSESDALQDMFIEMIQKDNGQGNNFFRTLMQMDEEAIQEIMDRMKQLVAVKGETFGLHNLSFEAVERWVQEDRQTTRQAAKAQQDGASQEKEKTTQESERREHEVKRFKEEQRQFMMEKERQARENERKKREHDEKEAEKQQKLSTKETKFRFW